MNPIKDGKFAKLPLDVAARPGLSSGAKVLYAIIVDKIGNNASAWPGQRSLAEAVGQTQNAVWSQTRELVEAGLLVVKRGRGKATNRYSLPPVVTPHSVNNGAAIEPVVTPLCVGLTPHGVTTEFVDTPGYRNQTLTTRPINQTNSARRKRRTAKPSPKKAKKTNPNHKPLTDYFCEGWKTKHGTTYPYQAGKDSLAVTNILGALHNDLAEGRRMVDAYLKLEGWAAKQGHKLSVMPGCLAELIAGSRTYDTDQCGNPDGSKAKRGRLR